MQTPVIMDLENTNQPELQPENTPTEMQHELEKDLAILHEKFTRVKSEIHKLIVGQDQLIDMLFISLLSGGHALIEGVPGIAKTLTSKLLAHALQVDYSRVQFTPDLMPADVTGTNIFNLQSGTFVFNKGPIFSQIVLIDEINRAPAKTQSALFEVMEEFQVTVDGQTHNMEQPYFVLATQNPLEQEGTYQLPEAQLDRFLMRILLSYPNLEEEVAILSNFSSDFKQTQKSDIQPVLTGPEIEHYKTLVEQIEIKPELLRYIAQIVLETRNNKYLYLGASPRASLAILRAAKANAALNGRHFVTPDDIKHVAHAVLNHRIILAPEYELEGLSTHQFINELIDKIEVPR